MKTWRKPTKNRKQPKKEEIHGKVAKHRKTCRKQMNKNQRIGEITVKHDTPDTRIMKTSQRKSIKHDKSMIERSQNILNPGKWNLPTTCVFFCHVYLAFSCHFLVIVFLFLNHFFNFLAWKQQNQWNINQNQWESKENQRSYSRKSRKIDKNQWKSEKN